MNRLPPPPRPRVSWMRLALLAAVAGSAACGSPRTANPFDPSSPANSVEDRVRVEVQNLNFNDVTVFAMRSGQQIRVGNVTGKTTTNFTINWNVAQSIWFQIDVVGGRSCRTNEIGVEANSRVWVSIPSDMGFGVCRVGRG